jgi:anti-sigma B factor antagonist
MKIDLHKEGAMAVVALEGRFDAHEVATIRKVFEQAIAESSGHVLVNLARVNFIDSSGLATLVQGMKRCREHNGDLVLSDLQQSVRIIFELTRLNQAFTIYGSATEALGMPGAA